MAFYKGSLNRIPWGIIEEHEAQALINHSQDLETLARRGGLSCDEAVAVLTDSKYPQVEASQIQTQEDRIKFNEKYDAKLREFVSQRIAEAVFSPI